MSCAFAIGIACHMNSDQLPPAKPWGPDQRVSAAEGCCVGNHPLGFRGISAGRQELAGVTAWQWGQGWLTSAAGLAWVQIRAQHHEPASLASSLSLGKKAAWEHLAHPRARAVVSP